MKYSTQLTLTTIAAALFASSCSGGDKVTINPCPGEQEKDRTLSISGMAELEVQPDEAIIDLGFSSTGKKMRQAHETTQKKVDDFVLKLEALGVPKAQTNLGAVTSAPNYFYPENAPARIESFTATVALVVKTKDFGKIPLVLDAGAEAGVSSVGGVRFRSTNLPELKKQVRDMAIKATREKAQQLAEGLGAKLGKIRSISENLYDSSAGYNPYSNRYQETGAANAYVPQASSSAASLPGGQMEKLSPGSFPLTLNIDVVYLLQ